MQIPRVLVWTARNSRVFPKHHVEEDCKSVARNGPISTYAEYYTSGQLVLLLGIAFSAYAPRSCSVAFYFMAISLGITYNTIYTMVDAYHSAGATFLGSITCGIQCLAAQQFVMFCLFDFRWQKAQCAISFVLGCFCLVLLLYVRWILRPGQICLRARAGKHDCDHSVVQAVYLERDEGCLLASWQYDHPTINELSEIAGRPRIVVDRARIQNAQVKVCVCTYRTTNE
jgi:hypothetical protein